MSNAGRPLKFMNAEELNKRIDEYFSKCEEAGRPKTITGLALALDTNRQTLLNYSDKDEFVDSIKRAKLECENFAEEHLFVGKSGVTGAIFNLKNNYGWVDQQVIKNESSNDLTEEEREQRIKELMDKVNEDSK